MVKIKSFTLDKNLLKSVVFDDNRKFIFRNWGFEIGNWYSFFSLEKMGGLNSSINDLVFQNNNKTFKYSGNINLINGSFHFIYSDEIGQNTIVKRIRLTAVKDSLLGDIALRAVISEHNLLLNGKKIKHKGKNIYKWIGRVDNPFT